jgi:hypothetical protein
MMQNGTEPAVDQRSIWAEVRQLVAHFLRSKVLPKRQLIPPTRLIDRGVAQLKEELQVGSWLILMLNLLPPSLSLVKGPMRKRELLRVLVHHRRLYQRRHIRRAWRWHVYLSYYIRLHARVAVVLLDRAFEIRFRQMALKLEHVVLWGVVGEFFKPDAR